jgi:hypothetical protein
MPAIVTVNVSVTEAPSPDTLQQTGAMLSQGGTNTSPGTKTLLTNSASLTPFLTVAKAVTSIAQSAGVATVTTTAPHGFPTNDVIHIVIAGANQSAYNGGFFCTITGASTFTFLVPSGTTTPATGTITYIPGSAVAITEMNNTFWAQGSNTPAYVLELGNGSVAEGVAFLQAWIANNPPGIAQGNSFWGFYSFLVPRTWDANPAFLAFLAGFESTTALEYFWVTTTLSTYTQYTAQMKCVKALIEAPAYGVWPANALTAIAYSGSWATNVLTAISWSGINGGTVTATTTSAHGVLPGEQFSIAGTSPAGYNGTFIALAGTTAETLVYALATNPGTETALGDLAASAGGNVTATTTSAHGVAVGQWFQIAGVLPAGYNGWWQAALGTTGSTLVYAVPAALGAESLLGTLVMSQNASAGVAAGTEFSRAGGWQVSLSFAPSSSSRGAIYNYSSLSGVTPFPTAGNNSLLQTLLNANIEVVGTGAEGGLSGTIAYGGNFLDGNTFSWWYGIDWLNINTNLNISNAVINGSNTNNPLLLNQDGINALQSVGASTIQSGITFGLIFGTLAQTELTGPAFQLNVQEGVYDGQAVINAVPFPAFYAASPSDYKIGLYAGFSVSFTPARGFDNITFNLNATQFVG